MTTSAESDAGIRVTAHPVFLAGHSDPLEPRYVFSYRIRIENSGGSAARLVWRHWFIHDPVGGDHEVEGEGVVGEQPRIVPGEVHEYESFCVLQGPEGHMEGYYEFRRDDASTFRAPIARFPLKVIHA
jgi:ApaG protein